jgi:hypothetical protein
MKNPKRYQYESRDRILKLLSDDEVASVSTAETATRLDQGEEFLDLERLGQGVQQADGSAPVMGRVLPRKAVHATTWSKILDELAAFRSEPAPSGKSR